MTPLKANLSHHPIQSNRGLKNPIKFAGCLRLASPAASAKWKIPGRRQSISLDSDHTSRVPGRERSASRGQRFHKRASSWTRALRRRVARRHPWHSADGARAKTARHGTSGAPLTQFCSLMMTPGAKTFITCPYCGLPQQSTAMHNQPLFQTCLFNSFRLKNPLESGRHPKLPIQLAGASIMQAFTKGPNAFHF